jgi:twinkle protein
MINWNDIDTKGKTSGTMKTVCPACSPTRKKKTDPCLSVNLDKGAAKCWHCEEVAWRDPITREKKEYTQPPAEWQNHTNLSDKLVKWFWEHRGINQDTLKQLKITEEVAYFPAKQKNQNAVVFNYFEGAKLVNKKYRSADKQFTQIKGAKKVFYGINDIADADEVYIVEGEMDKVAMWQHGIKNCVSVPNGANDLNDIFENCEEYLRNVKLFYIAVDMDEQGQKLEGELVKRLGKHKCKRIQFDGKDANDDLKSGKLTQSIANAFHYPVEGTFTATQLTKEIDQLYNFGLDKPLRTKTKAFKELDNDFSILRGQLTVVTGIPTHGKSNLIEWYILNLIHANNLKVSFFSPEHLPMEVHHAQLAEKVIGRPFYGQTRESRRMNMIELNHYKQWSNERIYSTAPDAGQAPDWEWLLGRFEEQIFRFGLDIFVIDAWNKVKRHNPDSLGEINDTLSRLTLFCQQHNVCIFLIAHPVKQRLKEDGTFEVPTLYSIKGTGDFYDQAHNGVTIYRDIDDNVEWHTQKIKMKHQGKKGTTYFRFCFSNGRYYRMGSEPDYNPMINLDGEQESVKFEEHEQAIKPNVEFDDSDDWLDNAFKE